LPIRLFRRATMIPPELVIANDGKSRLSSLRP